MVLLWVVVFIVSLAALIKGADWLLFRAERIGLALGYSPFLVGVVIVGFGTSFPELAASLLATWRGVTDVAIGNAIGSNVANVLLVIGVAAIVARRLTVTKNLIDLDLPLLAITTVIFLGVVWDREVSLAEAIFLVVLACSYLAYTVMQPRLTVPDKDVIIRDRERLEMLSKQPDEEGARPKIVAADYLFLSLGMILLAVGAHFLIESLVKLSELLNVGTGVITVTAVALGTSCPELLVSVKAVLKRNGDIAIGNIVGSNIFNILLVVGVPGLFSRLTVDPQTYSIGLPAMVLTTLLFIISGISRRIHLWEGIFYLALYVLFIAKMFDFA